MSKKNQPSFLSDVVAKAVSVRTGYLSWFEKLPADAQAECLAVRDAFRRGEIGTKAVVARAMIAAARSRGWSISAEKQVCQWLAKAD
jgi:hypothetical protein